VKAGSKRQSTTGHLVKAKATSKYSTIHRTVLKANKLVSPSISSAKTEKRADFKGRDDQKKKKCQRKTIRILME
jgi:hypothetical protein